MTIHKQVNIKQSHKTIRVIVEEFLHRIPGGDIIKNVLFRIYYFYPNAIVINPVNFMMTLWKCRVLANMKEWKYYPHFYPLSVFTAPFYWTRALEFQRFGRTGISPHLELGAQNLSQYWFYTLPSLYAYWKAGAVTLLFSMFGWWAFHFFWLVSSDVNMPWFAVIMLLSLFSTSFFRQTFVGQNYNVMGWMFMPAGLYGWFTGNWVIASLAWMAASFGSFTVVFLACLLSAVYALQLQSLLPVITVIPASVKLLFHFGPTLRDGTFLETITKIAKFIGFFGGTKAKYKRTDIHSLSIITFRFKSLLVYLQFAIVYFALSGDLPILLSSTIGIWLINSTVSRFADDQSMEILIFTVATAMMFLIKDLNWLLLLSYWLLVSPFYFKTSVLAPINVRPILEEMKMFLSPVEESQRILMAFDDPQGKYNNFFDGQRFLLDFPVYVATMKKVHLMPEFSSVFEVNYEGAPDFWGRSVSDVMRQMDYWNADYCIIYQNKRPELEYKWIEAGFKETAHFSWGEFEEKHSFSIGKSWGRPEWFLLKSNSIK